MASNAGLIFAVAVVLNFAWEMAEFPLYVWHGTWLHAARLSVRASLSDGALISLIYVAGRVALGRRDWHVRPGVRGLALAIVCGGTWAVAVELLALRTGRWAYGPMMPRLGWLGGAGAIPVAQMVVLPALAFRIAARLQRRGARATR